MAFRELHHRIYWGAREEHKERGAPPVDVLQAPRVRMNPFFEAEEDVFIALRGELEAEYRFTEIKNKVRLVLLRRGAGGELEPVEPVERRRVLELEGPGLRAVYDVEVYRARDVGRPAGALVLTEEQYDGFGRACVLATRGIAPEEVERLAARLQAAAGQVEEFALVIGDMREPPGYEVDLLFVPRGARLLILPEVSFASAVSPLIIVREGEQWERSHGARLRPPRFDGGAEVVRVDGRDYYVAALEVTLVQQPWWDGRRRTIFLYPVAARVPEGEDVEELLRWFTMNIWPAFFLPSVEVAT